MGQGVEKGVELISNLLNEILSPEQSTIVLLETMAGKGSDQFIKYGKTYVPCASDGQVVAKLIREYDEKYR